MRRKYFLYLLSTVACVLAAYSLISAQTLYLKLYPYLITALIVLMVWLLMTADGIFDFISRRNIPERGKRILKIIVAVTLLLAYLAVAVYSIYIEVLLVLSEL